MAANLTLPSFLDDIRPSFHLHEKDMVNLADMKEGQRLRVIINYKVIEKTKSFTVVKVNFVQPLPTKRKF